MTKLEEVARAADPFMRLVRMNAPLNLADDRPLRDILPGVWPTWGDLKELIDAILSEPQL